MRGLYGFMAVSVDESGESVVHSEVICSLAATLGISYYVLG